MLILITKTLLFAKVNGGIDMGSKVASLKLISQPDQGIDATDLLSQHEVNQNSDLLEEVELRSGEQTRVFLGVFKSPYIPKGFSISLSPNTIEDEEIVQQITKLELQDKQYEFILHIANYSSKAVSAEVRKLT